MAKMMERVKALSSPKRIMKSDHLYIPQHNILRLFRLKEGLQPEEKIIAIQRSGIWDYEIAKKTAIDKVMERIFK